MKKGFTLIEVIIIIAILGILFTISYPSLDSYVKKDRLKICSDRLVNDLRYAKIYAMSNPCSAISVIFEEEVIDGYCSYRIRDFSITDKSILKKVEFPNGVVVKKSSTFNENTIEFQSGGNITPFACSIYLKDTHTGREKKLTLTIGFSRIMVVDEG